MRESPRGHRVTRSAADSVRQDRQRTRLVWEALRVGHLTFTRWGHFWGHICFDYFEKPAFMRVSRHFVNVTLPPVSKQTSAFRGAFLFLSTILSTNSHGHWIGFGWIESDKHFEPRCRRQCTEHRSHRLYRQQSNVARLFAEPAFFADSAEKRPA